MLGVWCTFGVEDLVRAVVVVAVQEYCAVLLVACGTDVNVAVATTGFAALIAHVFLVESFAGVCGIWAEGGWVANRVLSIWENVAFAAAWAEAFTATWVVWLWFAFWMPSWLAFVGIV